MIILYRVRTVVRMDIYPYLCPVEARGALSKLLLDVTGVIFLFLANTSSGDGSCVGIVSCAIGRNWKEIPS